MRQKYFADWNSAQKSIKKRKQSFRYLENCVYIKNLIYTFSR